MRFLHIKGVLAGQHSRREAGILVYLILYDLRKILLVSLIFFFFFPHYTGIKILHVKVGNYGVTKCLRAWTNNHSAAALKLLQQTEI